MHFETIKAGGFYLDYQELKLEEIIQELIKKT
jgi:hypothetical protein